MPNATCRRVADLDDVAGDHPVQGDAVEVALLGQEHERVDRDRGGVGVRVQRDVAARGLQDHFDRAGETPCRPVRSNCISAAGSGRSAPQAVGCSRKAR